MAIKTFGSAVYGLQTLLIASLLGAAVVHGFSKYHQRRTNLSTRTALSMAGPLPPARLFQDSVYETIQTGKIAVIPEFLPASEIADLQRDAMSLWNQGHFSTDALASYGTAGQFDPTKDRAVLKLTQWKNQQLGNWDTRVRFAKRLQAVREDLSVALQRPRLTQGSSVTQYGAGSTEISYTRFGPGASLARHVDEHHEELKGKAGWAKPTRRSLSWLIYINDADWNADKHGGCLRCFERQNQPAYIVGARRDGDLQIGWLRATPQDPIERPVFMDAQRPMTGSNKVLAGGNCAMYVDDGEGGVKYISKDFNANPTLFVAGSEALSQQLLIQGDAEFKARFHLIEPPKSKLTQAFGAAPTDSDEVVLDVPPTGGTLVLFDSVSLPHEVLPTVGRERWATSGWLHEDQQPITAHEHFMGNVV